METTRRSSRVPRPLAIAKFPVRVPGKHSDEKNARGTARAALTASLATEASTVRQTQTRYFGVIHHGTSAFGVRLIGAFKLASALLLGAAGFGIFRMMNQDMGEVVGRFILRLHLDPENTLVHGVISRLVNIDRSRLVAVGAGTFLYALLEAAEGIGLLFRRHWASYLTIIATMLLFIPEGYEIAHKVDAVRIIVLLVNLAVLVYLIWKLKQERQGEGAPRR